MNTRLFVSFFVASFLLFVVKISYLQTDFLPQHSTMNDNGMIFEIVMIYYHVEHIKVKRIIHISNLDYKSLINKPVWLYYFLDTVNLINPHNLRIIMLRLSRY